MAKLVEINKLAKELREKDDKLSWEGARVMAKEILDGKDIKLENGQSVDNKFKEMDKKVEEKTNKIRELYPLPGENNNADLSAEVLKNSVIEIQTGRKFEKNDNIILIIPKDSGDAEALIDAIKILKSIRSINKENIDTVNLDNLERMFR